MRKHGIFEEIVAGNNEYLEHFVDGIKQLAHNNDTSILSKRIQAFENKDWMHNINLREYPSVFDQLTYSTNPEKDLLSLDLFYALLPLNQYITRNITSILSCYKVTSSNFQSLCFSVSSQINKFLKDRVIGLCLIKFMNEHNLQFKDVVIKSSERTFIKKFFNEYKALDNVVSSYLHNIFNYIREILANIETNHFQISEYFQLDSIELNDVELFKSDFHNGNKFTVFLIIDEDKKLVYKPKKSLNEQLFLSFISDIKPLFDIDIETYKILNINDFSIVEFVEGKPCLTHSSVENYYRNLGKYLFFFYILESSDIIGDNIIAVKQTPCFIDLELLLGRSLKINEGIIFTSKVGYYFQKSVSKSGILPRWAFGQASQRDVLLGATIAVNKQKIKKTVIVNRNTTQMNYTEALGLYSNEKDVHLPSINEEYFPIDDYIEVFSNGFIQAYKFFMANKTLLKSFVSKHFNRDVVQRFLIRDTVIYSVLLQESQNPSLLKSPSYYRDFIFEHLWAAYDKYYFNEQIIYSEYNQLRNGDIPLFYSNINSNSIISADGKLLAENSFSCDVVSNIFKKIECLSESDLDFQLSIITGTHNIYFENIGKFE